MILFLIFPSGIGFLTIIIKELLSFEHIRTVQQPKRLPTLLRKQRNSTAAAIGVAIYPTGLRTREIP